MLGRVVAAIAMAMAHAAAQRSCGQLLLGAAAPDTAFDQLFTQNGPGWTGGDSTYSVRLPDGRDVWMFSDSFIGTVDPATRLRSGSLFQAHNSLVVEDTSGALTTLVGGTIAHPASLFSPGDGTADWFWVGDGLVERPNNGDKLRILLTRFRPTGAGIFGFQFVGTYAATLSLPDLRVQSIVNLNLGSKISWSAAVMADGPYTYIYGDENHFPHVARVPTGSLTDVASWRFWNGSDWVPDSAASVRVLNDSISDEFSITKVDGGYLMVTMDTSVPFYAWRDIITYISCTPAGPWTDRKVVYQAPESGNDGIWAYNPHAHPEWTSTGSLLISYDINTATANGLVHADWYRPKFIRLPVSTRRQPPRRR